MPCLCLDAAFGGSRGLRGVASSRSGKAIRLSYDHKAVDMNERIRIVESGGFIMRDRVNGSLAITRALGDLPLKPFVTGHPFTTETALRPEDDVLILACDGVRAGGAGGGEGVGGGRGKARRDGVAKHPNGRCLSSLY